MDRERRALALLVLTAALGIGTLWLKAKPPPALRPAPSAPLMGSERPVPPVEPGAVHSPPGIDILRIEPTGLGAASGRAAPRAQIRLLAGGLTVGRATADERGEWVMIITTPVPRGDHSLSLLEELIDGGGIAAPDKFIVSIPKQVAGRPLVVRWPPNAPTSVLQSPEGPALRAVSLEAIDVDRTGALRFGGRASPHQVLHLYLDNIFLGQTQADAEGRWRLPQDSAGAQPKTGPGRHQVRVDGLDVQGAVAARLELTYERPDLASTPANHPLGAAFWVEPGEHFWWIRSLTPQGERAATIVYGEAAGQMLDPTIAYPGQVMPAIRNAPLAEPQPAPDH